MNEDRVRMKVTMTFEYDTNPAHYPAGRRDPHGMAELDAEQMTVDPVFMISLIEMGSSPEVVIEPAVDL